MLTTAKVWFDTPIPDEFIPFRLKKLVLRLQLIGLETTDNNNNYNNLLKFMKLHARTLKELVIVGKHPDCFYEFVFGKLKRLKTLRLNGITNPQDSRFYERLEFNRSVITLILICVTAQQELASNIETLRLSSNSQNYRSFIKHVAETLKKLKKLVVSDFNGEGFDGVQFEALESLEIHRVDHPINWERFTIQNPDIAELSTDICGSKSILTFRRSQRT